MADMERKVTYIYSVVDNMSKEHERISSEAKKASDATNDAIDGQRRLQDDVRRSTADIDVQRSKGTTAYSELSASNIGYADEMARVGALTDEAIQSQQRLMDKVGGATAEIDVQRSKGTTAYSELTDSQRDLNEGISAINTSMDESADRQESLIDRVERTTAEIDVQRTKGVTAYNELSARQEALADALSDAGEIIDEGISGQRSLQDEIKASTEGLSIQREMTASFVSEATGGFTSVVDVTRRAGDETDDTIVKQRQLMDEARRSGAEVQAQNVSVITQLTSIMALRTGVTAITNSMIQLGAVTDEGAEKIRKFNAMFSMLSGGVQILKSAQAMMSLLNLATLKNAMLNTYNSVITNPGRAAMVGVGLGAVAGVGTYFAVNALTGGNTTNTTNITIEGTADDSQQKTAQKVQQVYQLTGAGGYL